MEFLPRTLGTRPRLACEVRVEGVVAARAEDASGLLSGVSWVRLEDGVAVPRLRVAVAAGEVAGETSTPAANGASGGVGGGAAGRATLVAAVRKALEAVYLRTREVTLVVPDRAVRVLLLEFDALPGKAVEALAVVRFRLKKLLPFDADDAAVSYQVMATSKNAVQVVAVAMPGEVLAEYEGVVREAGFEPGAVLPSTLAALAGVGEGEIPMLVVNAGREGVTTAIVRAGVLLLHRSVDLRSDLQAEFGARDSRRGEAEDRMALVDRESSAEEWARQEPVRFADPVSPIAALAGMQTAVLDQEMVSVRRFMAAASEVAQAVSVAAAYFEDTLETAPAAVLVAGTMGADALAAVLEDAGVEMGAVPVQEMVGPEMLGPGTASAGSPGGVPLGWLAGVRGALAN